MRVKYPVFTLERNREALCVWRTTNKKASYLLGFCPIPVLPLSHSWGASLLEERGCALHTGGPERMLVGLT